MKKGKILKRKNRGAIERKNIMDIKKIRFIKIKDGEWFQPKMKNHLMKCCDCGLVHIMNFKIVKNRVQIQAKRKQKQQFDEEDCAVCGSGGSHRKGCIYNDNL